MQLNNTHPYLPEKLWRSDMASGYSAMYKDGNRKMQPFFKTNAITLLQDTLQMLSTWLSLPHGNLGYLQVTSQKY